ncbi:ribosomal RNA processing protein 1A-like, partial [Tropilaelaps mercedesae]
MSSEEIRFAQLLASNERQVRDKALARMKKWLRLRSHREEAEFSIDGMMKLWKGLFYCMWMADKPLIQEELADNIGSLLHSFAKPTQSYLFIGAFFKTMARNHDHIDKFRIDKFLMLTRRLYRHVPISSLFSIFLKHLKLASLQYLKARDWEYKHVQKYISTLRESVLSTKQDAREMALGFRLHFFDIFLEEMARVGEGQLPQKRAHNFLEPFYEVLTYCKSPMVVEGVRDKVFLELVKLNSANLEEESGNEELEETASAGEDGDNTGQQIRQGRARELALNSIEDDYSEVTADGEGAELHLLPIDFDMSAVKASLLEFSRAEGIKAINRKAIEVIIRKIIDLENGVNPFALSSEDSGSDIELTEGELIMAEKRLRLLEKQCANEAENYLIPDRDRPESADDEGFEMEDGDLSEFEKTFVDDNTARENRNRATKKGRKNVKRRRANTSCDHLPDSDEEHIGEIEKEIDEMNFQNDQESRKRNVNGVNKSAAKYNSNDVGRQK